MQKSQMKVSIFDQVEQIVIEWKNPIRKETLKEKKRKKENSKLGMRFGTYIA